MYQYSHHDTEGNETALTSNAYHFISLHESLLLYISAKHVNNKREARGLQKKCPEIFQKWSMREYLRNISCERIGTIL